MRALMILLAVALRCSVVCWLRGQGHQHNTGPLGMLFTAIPVLFAFCDSPYDSVDWERE